MNGLCLKKSCHTAKKFIFILINVLLLGSLFLSTTASAALNLELTQGVANQLPIAILPFESTENFASENDIGRVIQSDLSHSGQFKVTWVKTQSLPQAAGIDKVSVAYWRAHHIDDVVLGKITPIGQGQYRVHVDLVHVAQGHKQILAQRAIYPRNMHNVVL
ncbi:hypothetical protein [Rickettsiella endosymbiont of Miltochrista miniata]|uniref:hypothetical protein n=1 Tax=Rickettsiella endosymbiont of Miltochrista miniata TaxID=3066239 RepID=UPI00313B3D35